MKVVINTCFGGYGLSLKAMHKLIELGCEEAVEYMVGLDEDDFGSFYPFSEDEKRNHPMLIRVVEELGAEANGRWSDLKIVDIPDNVEWYIHDYDGIESVHEQHRSWR